MGICLGRFIQNLFLKSRYQSRNKLLKPVFAQFNTLGYTVRQAYNDFGYLAEVRNASDNSLLWRADSVNAESLTVHQTLGNGLTTIREYDPARQWIRGIRTGANDGTEVQNLSFSFDPLGNLTNRTDDTRGLAEAFRYDNLNRLIAAQVQNGALIKVSFNICLQVSKKVTCRSVKR